MADKKISELPLADALTGPELIEFVQGGVNKRGTPEMIQTFIGDGITREFNRTFVEALVFDKNEIFHAPFVMTDDIDLTIAVGGLVDQTSSMRFRVTADGIHAINFGSGFDFLYGITNGQVLEAGTYEVYLLYTNGSVVVNVPGVSSETSGLAPLETPAGFSVAADGENALDLSWSDVANETGYQIEKSTTGTGGWVLFSSPAVGATSDTETGLNPGTTVFYRIKALGDGVTHSDSAYAVASGTTTSSGDVTAPTFTFSPLNSATDVSVNDKIIITANEPIRNADGSEVTNANVAAVLTLKETNSGGANIAFTATIDVSKTIITITPTTVYGDNQVVYVAIDNVEDVSGNEISLTSITFTTNEYTTFFDGSTNHLKFGDILDSNIAATDSEFVLKITVNDLTMTGGHWLFTKMYTSDNQRCFALSHNGTTVSFQYFMTVGSSTNFRIITWTGTDLTTGEHDIELHYDGSIDTADGLNRVTLIIDGVTQGSKAISSSGGTLSGALFNATSQLAFGTLVSNAGTPGGSHFSGKAKDLIIEDGASNVLVNVPILAEGTDTSGNGRHGTWV